MKQYFSEHPERLASVLQWLGSLIVSFAAALWSTQFGHLPITVGGSLIALGYCAWMACLTVATMNMKDGQDEYNGALCVVFLLTVGICCAITFISDIPGPVFGSLGAIFGGLAAMFLTRPLWRKPKGGRS